MIQPENEAALAELVKDTSAPLRIVGGGTRDIGQPVEGDRVSLAALNGISLYEPGALTVVAGAGTPLADIQDALAAEGQRLAFEPMDFRALLGTRGESTIGGVVAANASGPRRIQVGACRDSLLGVRFVDGEGRVLKNGGRVMKNVTGYDLVKLLAGSWGTLGVLSEVSLKVQAIPETEATLVGHGLDAKAAVRVMSAALGSPYDLAGAAWVSEAGEVRLRLEGLADSVKYRVKRLQGDICADWDVVEGPSSASLWRDIRDVAPFSSGQEVVWRLSVKPSDMPSVLNALGEPSAICDWGGGLIWASMEEPNVNEVRTVVTRFGGHATLIRATEAQRLGNPVFHPEAAPLAAISRALREKFDPRGLLNPGLMG